MTRLSVVIPAYNEAANIIGALQDVLDDVASVVGDLEVIVVNDGSTDATAKLAETFASKEPRIRVLSQANSGHGPALKHGLNVARGEWVFLLDSDRQVSLAEFGRHWNLARDYDVILGIRRPRIDPFYRRVISALMRMFLHLVLNQRVADGGAPYKLLRRTVWMEARDHMRPDCWIPSVLLAVAALKSTRLRVLECPIEHRARERGPSTLNLRRLMTFCWQGVADVLYFRTSVRDRAVARADE